MTDQLNEAQLGVELELFKSSSVGQYLHKCAYDDIIDATEALTTVDPDDTKQIIKLQNKVYRANSFMGWVEKGIEAGNFAADEIRENL